MYVRNYSENVSLWKEAKKPLNYFIWFLFVLLLAGWIYLWITVTKLEKRLFRIEERIKPQGHPSVTEPTAKREKPLPSHPVVAKPSVPIQARPSIPTQAKPKKEAKQSKPSRPKLSGREWEFLIGGRWLNRIGAVALVIGLLFFVKYAFDHRWVNEIVRVLLGGVCGILLLLGGRHFYKKQLPVFAQGLIGAGIAILYGTVFASFNFYHFVSFGTAYVLMILVTLLALWQALAYDALSISLLGWIGGFVTPMLLGSGFNNQVGYLTYLAFLALGMVLIAWKKRKWVILYHLTLYAVYIFALVLMGFRDHPLNLLFLTVYWLIFYLYELEVARKPGVWPVAHLVTACFNALFWLAGCVLLSLHHTELLGEKIYLFSLAYLLPLAYLKWKNRENALSKAERNRCGLTFLFLFTFAGLMKWKGLDLANAWGIEAFVIGWWALREKAKQTFYFGAALYGVAALLLLGETVGISNLNQWIPVWNRETFSYFLWAGLVTIQAYQIKKSRIARWESFFQGFYAGSAILLFFWLSIEVNLYFNSFDQHGLTASWNFNRYFILYMIWALYSLLVHETGLKERVRLLIPVSWGMMFISLAAVAAWGMAAPPPDSFVPLFNIRFLAFLVHIGAVILMLWRGRKAERWLPWKWAPALLLGALMVLLFEIVTLEVGSTSAYFAPLSGDYTRAEWMKGFFISISWVGYSFLSAWIGSRYRNKLILFFAWGSLGLEVLAVMIHGLMLPARMAFVPVINIRFLAFILSAGCLYFYQSMGQHLKAKQMGVLLTRITLVILLFELLTVEVSDTYAHHLWEMDQSNPILLNQVENQKQMALSVAWIIYSLLLILFGIWRKWAWLRWSAIGLFGITIFKIFLFDLSFIGTLYRIFSFIALGVILLAVSYLYQRYKERF
jgi:uncharacterized membrane protein